MKITDINIKRNDDWRERYWKTRVYFDHEGENVLENFGNRFARPYHVYREVLPEVAEKLGAPDAKFRWSQKAGCSCGCSPGFIVTAGSIGKTVWVKVAASELKTDNVALANNRRAQLVNQLAAEAAATKGS